MMKQVMYKWAKKTFIDLRAEKEHIWRFANSENHHAMGVVTTWFFCGVLKEDETYALNFKHDEGTNSGAFFRWTDLENPVQTGIEIQILIRTGTSRR